MRIEQYYGLLPFVASALLTIAIGLSFKAVRKRLQRRSPLAARQIGHLPGQQLVERITHHEGEVMSAIMLMYISAPIMFMLWAGQTIDWQKQSLGLIEWTCIVGALLMFGYGLRDYIRHFIARERAKDGLLAERVTGMQLNRLIAQDCIVMHDLPCDGFNIDHVVIAPRGVYAVETKSFRKPKGVDGAQHVSFDGTSLRFPDFLEKDAPAQALRQAAWLGRELTSALQWPVDVTAALALPGWYVDQPPEVWARAAVKVFSPMGNGIAFMAKDVRRLDETQRSLIARALALRYPRIES